jgi:outer membrane biogenesis lipoprotein LolB
MNKNLLALIACAALAGCGVDAASSAATVAEMKKQEIQEGQKTMARAQAKVGAAMQQMQQRADSDLENH